LKELTLERVEQKLFLWHEKVDHSKEGEEDKATDVQPASKGYAYWCLKLSIQKGKGMRKKNMSFSLNLKEKSSKKVHSFINFIILANWYAMLCFEWLDALDMHDKITSK
jgi:hypothetical protein